MGVRTMRGLWWMLAWMVLLLLLLLLLLSLDSVIMRVGRMAGGMMGVLMLKMMGRVSGGVKRRRMVGVLVWVVKRDIPHTFAVPVPIDSVRTVSWRRDVAERHERII
jgi:hypothetical protein